MLHTLTAIPTIIALWLVSSLFRLIPITLCWKFGTLLGSVAYKIMPSRRATVQKNLTIVASQNPEIQVTESLIKQVFQHSLANLTCALKTYTLTPAQIEKITDIQLHPEFTQAIENKTGAILCLAHMGNWEILTKTAPLVHGKPFPFGAVYRPLDNRALDKYIASQRHKYGCKMFAKGNSITPLTTFIKNGGVLGILADQRAGGSKNNRPFFGHPSSRSKLPAILHRRTHAPLFSISVHSPSPGKWTLQVLPIPIPEHADTEQTVTLITQRYEQTFTNHLLDVFWLHTYWREKRDKNKPA